MGGGTMTLDTDAVQVVGYAAAILTTSSFIPQALMTLRTRDVSGISATMYGAFVGGVALWLAYGLLMGDWPIICANAVALVLSGTILVITLRERRRQRRAGPSAPPPPAGPQNEKRTPAE
jgi:MtN3 and saliva related transmembrane protein